ncbi:MAG: CRISPR-associated protein, Csm1 family, partial [Dehalococcoidia bacterium]|nr:CRISPR-associated protein, Csm1 family [Dehalococcoidia bacterium]
MSADFVHAFSSLFSASANPELLRTLVQHHHESAANFPPSLRVDGIDDPHERALATVVSQADHFSASERGEGAEQWQDFKSTALASVMEQVRIPKEIEIEEDTRVNEDRPAPSLHFHARPLNGPGNESFGDVFPENFDAYEPGEMNSLLKDFGDDFKRWSDRKEPPVFETLLSHLLHFFYKYAWCIPSNTQEAIPDVSIYDHLKTTAAIAACLYIYHDDKHSLTEKAIRGPGQKRFCLVAGDVSGIQKYIFAVSNIGAGGVARKLRSRSLFVQLVTEVCAHKILNAFGLPHTNFLMSAGGNFHLLVPNVSGAAAVLAKVNQEIDQWFLQELNGELALNLASFNFDGPGFSASDDTNDGFGGVLRNVNEKLAQMKQKRFTSLWVSDGKWQEERFTVSQDFKGQEACRSCGKFPREDNEDVCTHCKLDRETGKDLPNRNSIVFYAGEGKGEITLPYGSAAVISGAPRGSIPPYLTLKLNSSDLGGLYGFAAQSKFISNYVPVCTNEMAEKARKRGVKDIPDVGQLATFGILAAQASGRPYLGFL